jgi:hypothetical protein
MKRQIRTVAAVGGLLVMTAVAVSQEEPATNPTTAEARVTVETDQETFTPRTVTVQAGPGAQPAAEPVQVQLPAYGAGGFSNYYGFHVHRGGEDHHRKVHELVQKWKAAEEGDARGKVEGELRKALEDEFAARMEQHRKQVEELEARVKQLREQLDRRRERQEDIINFRLQELQRDAQGLGWGGEPIGPGGNAAFVRGLPAPVAVPPARGR